MPTFPLKFHPKYSRNSIRMRIETILRPLFFFCLPLFAFAQTNNENFNNPIYESWNSVVANYRLNQHIEVSTEVQLRLKSSGEAYDMSLFEIQSVYEPVSFLEIGVGYRSFDRLENFDNDLDNIKYNRFYGFLKTSLQIDRLDLNFRLQHQVKNQITVSDNPKENSRWRYRLASRYNIPNWSLDPRFSVEFFIKNAFLTNEAYDKVRFSIGSKWDISKQRSLAFRYLLQSEVNTSNPMKYHILSLKYVFEIGSLKKD